MKRNKIIPLLLTFFGTLPLISGCSSENGGNNSSSDKPLHVVDPNGMGGEDILDDGGKINPSDPIEVAVGVETFGEHRIIIGEDKDKYQTNGDDTAIWKNGDNVFNRIRHNDQGTESIFTLNFEHLTDTSRIGVMVNLINNRTYSCIQISNDMTAWTDIGYADKEYNGIKGDYTTCATTLLGKEVSDSNLYQCYYQLEKYLRDDSKILYLKTTWSDQHYTKLASPVGTDLIGYVSYFDELEIKYDYL